MSTLKTRNIREVLVAKGFREYTHRDHCYLFFHFNGKKSSVYTKTSHGQAEVGDGLIAAMAKQVKLNKSQFRSLVECSLTADSYVAILISGGYVKEVQD